MIFNVLCPKCNTKVLTNADIGSTISDLVHIEDVVCQHCGHNFDIALEIEITASAVEIETVTCERCGQQVRTRKTVYGDLLMGEIKGDPYNCLCNACLANALNGGEIELTHPDNCTIGGAM